MSKKEGRMHLEARRIDAFGDGVGKLRGGDHEGLEGHCPGLLPGERGRVAIEALARRARPARAHLRLVERTHPHPERRDLPCAMHVEARGRCTGCPLMSAPEALQIQFKRARIEARLGATLDEFVASPRALGYRQSAKRVVGGELGRLRLGSYARGSHRVVNMAGCVVDHPRILEAVEEIVQRGNALGIEPYVPASDDGPARGDLRYVWLKTDGERVLTTLIGAHDQSPARARLAPALERSDGVAWSVQSGPGNAIRGEGVEFLHGLRSLELSALGARVEIGPLGFLQPNPPVAAQAYAALLADPEDPEGAALEGALAFDLYAGAGITTAGLRAHFGAVEACESHPESARALGCTPMRTEEFLHAALDGEARPDLVVANPPRGGFSAAVREALARLSPPRLHVMSCNPDTLARDLDALSSHFELVGLRAFDTLPQTAHVEVVASLRRR